MFSLLLKDLISDFIFDTNSQDICTVDIWTPAMASLMGYLQVGGVVFNLCILPLLDIQEFGKPSVFHAARIMQSAPRFYSYLNEMKKKQQQQQKNNNNKNKQQKNNNNNNNIARPAESRPTEKIYFQSVPYNHTECLSVAS